MLYSIPQLEEGAYRRSNFPSGEVYIKLLEPVVPENATILFRYQGDASLIELMMLTDALKRNGAKNITLLCPYFPGARCDRIEEEQIGEALSVKVYADLINSQGYSKVVVFDPHSNVTPALINNVKVVSNRLYARCVVHTLKYQDKLDVVLISPDVGATKKTRKVAEDFNPPITVIQGEKKRDLKTGSLVPGECVLHIPEGFDLKDKDCVIIDDICSKGGTFIALAKELKKYSPKSIILLVSHYEGTADISKLNEAGISAIYATDSLPYKVLGIGNPFIKTNILSYVS